MHHSQNRLLACLPKNIFAELRPHITLVELPRGKVLSETGTPITHMHFPHSGIVSLVVELSVGLMVETAMVGRDGVVHAAPALDGRIALNRAIVQAAGFCSLVPVDAVVFAADQFRDFRSLLIRHEQVLLAQAQQSGACNASHLIEARLCRWLLRTRDLLGSDDLAVTQEFLAQMLGVQRSSLSVTAHTLQKAGLISYKRGRVQLLNIEGLKESACECYETVRGHYDRMLNGHGETE